MDLHSVRQNCIKTLSRRGISQQTFCEKYGLSFSWLNKFLRADDPNPRINSLTKLQEAIEAEKRAS